MEKISPIKEKILYFLEKQEITKVDFCEKTGISYANLKGKGLSSEIGGTQIGKILSIYPEISPEWLLTGQGEMFKTNCAEIQKTPTVAGGKISELQVKDNDKKNIIQEKDKEISNPMTTAISAFADSMGKHNSKGIPLIPVEAMMGYGNGDVQVMDYDIQEDYIITPELSGKGIKYLIRASGSSMMPKYNNGDLLACRPITDISFIQWGKVYVLDTEQGPLVKRLYPCAPEDNDCLECRSDNYERYPPFKIRKESIRRIAIVVAVLRLE